MRKFTVLFFVAGLTTSSSFVCAMEDKEPSIKKEPIWEGYFQEIESANETITPIKRTASRVLVDREDLSKRIKTELTLTDMIQNVEEHKTSEERHNFVDSLFNFDKKISYEDAMSFTKMAPVKNIQLLNYRELSVLVRIEASFPGALAEKIKQDLFQYFIRQNKDESEKIYQILVTLYLNGIGVEQNIEEGFRCVLADADQGNIRVQRFLGHIYFCGEGFQGLAVPRDLNLAIKYYTMAANQGDVIAQSNLSICYARGEGGEKNPTKALEYYKLAADQGNSIAQFNLAECYLQGIGVKHNRKLAHQYYQLATDGGYLPAQVKLGKLYDEELNSAMAIPHYKAAADQGHTEAQCLLAEKFTNDFQNRFIRHAFKFDVLKYYQWAASQKSIVAQGALGKYYLLKEYGDIGRAEARKNLQMAANKGHHMAQFYLGLCSVNRGVYEMLEPHEISFPPVDTDIGLKLLKVGDDFFFKLNCTITVDVEKAVGFYKLAADYGNAIAQLKLAICYAGSIGVSENDIEALKYFKLAADQGCAAAQCNLGLYYAEGGFRIYETQRTIFLRDKKKAFKYFKLAADQANSIAQVYLAKYYLEGKGIEKNKPESLKYLKLAVSQENPMAQHMLGMYYFYGCCVEKDLKEACKWYKKAADQGYIKAQLDLGKCYFQGEGVSQDIKEAVRYYQRAACQGEEEAVLFLQNSYLYALSLKADQQQIEENTFPVLNNINNSEGMVRQAFQNPLHSTQDISGASMPPLFPGGIILSPPPQILPLEALERLQTQQKETIERLNNRLASLEVENQNENARLTRMEEFMCQIKEKNQ